MIDASNAGLLSQMVGAALQLALQARHNLRYSTPHCCLTISCSAVLLAQPPECVCGVCSFTAYNSSQPTGLQQHICQPRQPLLMQDPVQIQRAWSQMTTTACCCAFTALRLAVQLHCNSCLMMHAQRFRYSHLAPAGITISHLVLLGLLYKAYPDCCQHRLQIVLRLRPYPVRRHRLLYLMPYSTCL